MSDCHRNTVLELAEIIADQRCELDQLREEFDEQNEIILGYELDQEETEKVDAALYTDLLAIDAGDCSKTLTEVLEEYFGE